MSVAKNTALGTNSPPTTDLAKLAAAVVYLGEALVTAAQEIARK